ncbi:MAG: exopolysaccharide transport family protein [Neorhizobium sp.]|nr:exopolysaccharide transport family protein [Neorhizobium sp.]
MSSLGGGHQDVDIDLKQVFSAVWKRRKRILAATVAAAALSFVGATLIKPSYKGEARLLIEARSQNLNGGDAPPSGNDPILDPLNVTSQAQILQSTDLIKRVAREFKLQERKEFDPAAQSMLPDPLVLLGLRQDPMKLDPEDRVIQEFRSKLNVFPVENSRVIAIEFSSHDPKLSADVPNKMAQIYLQIQSGAKLDNHQDTAKWLEPEIASLTQKVRDAESKIADYRAKNGLFQSGDNASLPSRQLNDITGDIARARIDRANAEARVENVRAALRAGRSLDTLADVVGSQVIQRLKETEANLQAQINDLSTALMDNHPRLRGLRAQLSAIRAQIDSETKKILGSLDNDAEMARLRERQLTQQMNGLKADAAKAGEDEVGLRSLEREAAAQRQLLETYLARYREATSRLDGNSSPADARIVSNAVEPSEPFFPKVVPIVIVVTLATFLLYSLSIVAGELFSGRAMRPVGRRRDGEDDSPGEPATAVIVPPDVQPLPAALPVPAPVVAPEIAAEDKAPSTARADAEHGGDAAPQPVHRMQAQAGRFRRMAAVSSTNDLGEMPTAVAMPLSDDAPAVADVEVTPVFIAKAAPPASDAPANDDANHHANDEETFSVASVAQYLHRRAVPLAVAVSPAGDEGSTATVMLARTVSEEGRSVVLVDLTGTACPSRLMSEDARLPGITDLLCGEAAFGDAIHRDRLSDAHIIPQGASDPVVAMRGIDRLTMILDALVDAYDLVIVECGAAEISGLKRLTPNADADIVLSAPGYSDEQLASQILAFEAAGYSNILVISETGDAGTPLNGRSRAA